MVKRKEGDKSPRNFDNDRYNRSESFGDEEPDFSDDENFVDDITDEGEARISASSFSRRYTCTFHGGAGFHPAVSLPVNAIPNINIF
jgi:hypothetical protein